jgi:hypothetical protein
MKAGTGAGNATAAVGTGTETLVGVLESAVEANETNGNVLIHGSCPADALVFFDATNGNTPATAAQIAALRAIGVYV